MPTEHLTAPPAGPLGLRHDVGRGAPEPDAADLVRAATLGRHEIDVELRAPGTGDNSELRFTMYVTDDRVSLSTVLPILHSLGAEVLDERPYPLQRADGSRAWIYDFALRHPGIDTSAAELLRGTFCDAFLAAWHGHADVDDFNRLIVAARLTWQQAALMRAYAKYLRQAGFTHGPQRIALVLAAHPQLCATIVALFAALFDPDRGDAAAAARLDTELGAAIETVAGQDADRILRAYAGLVRATTRTNFYRTPASGRPRSAALALKFDAGNVAQLPQPRPRYEVFVHSPRVEGVHLRYGDVARGGLRWSDRTDDFRTEILGLVKAQAVKNAVIVPVGAKGGFVAKRPPAVTGNPAADRDALRAEAVSCYRTFVAALLDITDDIDEGTGTVLQPAQVVRRDEDDPYLVVAADKGTATFSDHANDVAREYGFWLGDAFASGGSVGYDHKTMGITARGAWESVRRHFREFDHDVDTQPFTVAGIGDMSGDVFGNGMLLSRQIRLIAAFDHRHIFLDPQPDSEASFTERQRLFNLERSSWADYDVAMISDGGGVFDRGAKSVRLSGPARLALGIEGGTEVFTPQEVIMAILRSPVDLLFNGGIGTYIKADQEAHLDVGDKANDAVRVDATEVRARVIAEGGNLGVTPAGRVALALRGHHINTDALDNSAGVDCSDHEVNIKVLLDSVVSAGDLDSKQRNQLLRDMTDDVANLVLAHNVAQNDLIGTCRASTAARVAVHGRQIRQLEQRRGLDRALEALPDDAEIVRRAARGEGLTSPELATLIAHVKLSVKAELLASDLPDSAAFADRLRRYFPRRLADTYPDAIAAHRLRREIVSTSLTNEVIDTAGLTFVHRLTEDTGASTTDAVRAYAAVSAIFAVPELISGIRATTRSTIVHDEMVNEVRRLVDRATRWMLSHRPQPLAVNAEIARYRAAAQILVPRVAGYLAGPDADVVSQRAQRLVDAGADQHSAVRLFSLLHGYCVLDIVDIADTEGREITEVAELYYALNAYLSIDHLLTAISSLDDTTRWAALARLALRNDVYAAVRTLCVDVLSVAGGSGTASAQIAEWAAVNSARLARSTAILDEILAAEIDVTTLTVATHHLRDMIQLRPA